MDFRYSEEQLALQDTLQRFISRDYDFERRRALVRSPLDLRCCFLTSRARRSIQ